MARIIVHNHLPAHDAHDPELKRKIEENKAAFKMTRLRNKLRSLEELQETEFKPPHPEVWAKYDLSGKRR